MEVILLENISNLGRLGDTVTVKPGYARNFLIPQHRAVSATPENIAKFEAQRAELEQRQDDTLAAAEARARALADVEVSIARRAGTEGRLFGSVGTQDIAEVISGAGGVEIKKHEVQLPSGPLRQIGEYEIHLRFHADVEASVKVSVVAEA